MTRVLVVLAAACALGLWLDRGPSTRDEVRLARRLLPEVRLGDLSAVEIGAVRLARDADGVWTLADGRRVDGDRLAAFFAALEFAHVERRLPLDDASRHAYGLGPAAKPLRLVAGGRTWELALGARDLSRRFVYASRAGERDALLVEASLDEQSPPGADDWVSPALVLDDPAAVRKLELGALTLANGRVPWVLAPRPGRAGDRARELMTQLGRVRAERVVACAPPAPEAGPPITLRGDGRALLAVSAAPPGRCPGEALSGRRVDGACLCVPAPAWRALVAAAQDPWLHELAPLALDDVSGVGVDGVRGFTLRRDAHRWLLALPGAKGELDADDAAVRQWLTALLALRLEGAPEEPRAPSAGARTTLELRTAREQVRLTLDGDRLQRRFDNDEALRDDWRAPPALRALLPGDARRVFHATQPAVADKVAPFPTPRSDHDPDRKVR